MREVSGKFLWYQSLQRGKCPVESQSPALLSMSNISLEDCVGNVVLLQRLSKQEPSNACADDQDVRVAHVVSRGEGGGVDEM